MLRTFVSFIGLAFVYFSQISAVIIETNEISMIQTHGTKDSLFLFNVTDTLYSPINTLADHQWRTYFSERVHALVTNEKLANRIINKVKNDIVTYLPKKAVEEVTPLLIMNLQKQYIPVLGITQKQKSTSYADNFGVITRDHLLTIGINLENTLSYLKVKNDDGNSLYFFDFGLIFTNKNPVGPALLSFLNRLEYKPTKIIMIDNSLDNLENAEAALISTGIEFHGYRYGRSDTLKANFDPILGNIQFFFFMKEGKIISDEDARQVKHDNPEIDFGMRLDHFIYEYFNN